MARRLELWGEGGESGIKLPLSNIIFDTQIYVFVIEKLYTLKYTVLQVKVYRYIAKKW